MQMMLGVGGAFVAHDTSFLQAQRASSGQEHKSASHQCDVCGHKFVWRWMLSRHMMTHTGEKPHACPHCDYKAARKEQVRSHMQNRHRGMQAQI